MPTAWNQMSPDEKLDEVHDSNQRLIRQAGESPFLDWSSRPWALYEILA
jgi:hypothetical protein